MKLFKHLFVAAVVLTCAFMGNAQNTTSPYSAFGYGLLNDNATSSQRALGGVGYAMQNGRQVNAMNPASYASTDSLTFLWDIGADVSMLWSKENALKGHSTGGGLDYITMQFPISKTVGGSFGLVPFTSVGYSFGNTLDNGTESQTATGGLNQLYGGLSFRPFKGFSIGANMSYLFGTTLYENYLYTNTSSTSLYERIMQVRSWNLQLGIQYAYSFNENNKATLGLVYSPKKSLQGHTWGAKYDLTNDTRQDTIGYSSLSGNYQTPNSYGIGLGYNYGSKIYAELDVTYQQWKDVKYANIEGFTGNNITFDNRWKVATGLQYTPNYRGSYAKRIQYRIGGYYNHDYINVLGNNVREYGVSIGFGLPTPSTKTLVNLGFEYKHRSTTPVSKINENYFNITLGVTFNEMWFRKSKIY